MPLSRTSCTNDQNMLAHLISSLLTKKRLFISYRTLIRSGFKTSDQVQRQGVPRIESGAYTVVREHFNVLDNTAIGPQMGF
jgi:hypothetical protein